MTLLLCAVVAGRAALAQTSGAWPAPPAASAAQDDRPAALRDGPHDMVVNGVRLWYRIAGDGSAEAPPVLFLHGGPGYNSHSFAVLAGPRLERGLRMIYLDQRGCGRSERPWTGQYSLDTLVADIEAFRVALGVPRISVIGHSFGGTLALEYAAAHPDHVARMVLVSAAADLPSACQARAAWLATHYPAEFARARAAVGPDTAAQDCALAFRALSGEAFVAYNNAVMFPDSLLRVRQDSVDAASGLRNTGELSRALFDGGLLTYRFAPHAERLTMPVLVLAGRCDSAIGLDPQRALAGMLANARFEEYERGGHFLYLDEPERFARDVTAFLTAPPGESAPGDGLTLPGGGSGPEGRRVAGATDGL